MIMSWKFDSMIFGDSNATEDQRMVVNLSLCGNGLYGSGKPKM